MTDFGGADEIAFERRGRAGIVTLTRPKALNALTHGMVLALTRALDAWEADAQVSHVLVKGEGRAFCAGGDIMAVYRAGREGAPNDLFFADEYRLNAKISHYSKPYISLIDGIVMGGGFGISCHGSHRVMTENAMFAMPEVGIGFFPDVGGSFVLPRLEGEFGAYLALTGNRIRYGDALWSGLATHCVASADVAALFDALVEADDMDAAVKPFLTHPEPETPATARKTIDAAFGALTVGAVLEALDKISGEGAEFAAAARAAICSKSPTSLAVTRRQLLKGARLSMDDCMRMELRILHRMLRGADFYEGIRAALVDKGSTPQWNPASLDDVKAGDVDSYFAPLGKDELSL